MKLGKLCSFAGGIIPSGLSTGYGRGYQGRAMIWRSPLLRWQRTGARLIVGSGELEIIIIGGRMGYKKKRKTGKGSR